MAKSWLEIVVDDLDRVPQTPRRARPRPAANGSIRIAVWSYVWLSRAHFLLGGWDDRPHAAERAVSLLEETGHEWLRPLARWVAVDVFAAEGSGRPRRRMLPGRRRSGGYELMIVAAALPRAGWRRRAATTGPCCRRSNQCWRSTASGGRRRAGILAMATPLRRRARQHGTARPRPRTSCAPHEELAEERRRRSSIARLARVRGRLEAAPGGRTRPTTAFRHGLDQIRGLSLPVRAGVTELAYGQMLRRRGQRRAAMSRLDAARERFAALRARPFVERCDVELQAAG